MLVGKYISLDASIRKEDTFKINDLSTELEKLEKGLADKPQKLRRK